MTHGRPARPFLARGQAAVSRPRLRPRRHDPRRAGALRGDRRARLSRARARLAGARSTAITPTPTPAAISSPPTTPRAWWCAQRHDRRRHAQSERDRGAKSRAACGADRRSDAWRDAGRPPVRRAPCRSRPTICSCISRCSMRSTCGCAPPRSWSPDGRAADALVAAALQAAVPRPHRAARAAADALPPSHPAQEKIKAIAGGAAAFICVGETLLAAGDASREATRAMRLMLGDEPSETARLKCAAHGRCVARERPKRPIVSCVFALLHDYRGVRRSFGLGQLNVLAMIRASRCSTSQLATSRRLPYIIANVSACSARLRLRAQAFPSHDDLPTRRELVARCQPRFRRLELPSSRRSSKRWSFSKRRPGYRASALATRATDPRHRIDSVLVGRACGYRMDNDAESDAYASAPFAIARARGPKRASCGDRAS